MRKMSAVLFFLLGALQSASAGLLINEVVTATQSDWVELVLRPGDCQNMDISRLYVTMYYGSNEPLSSEPVTLSVTDNPMTPWDDRFAVVHLTAPGIPDETDYTGDTNHNGARDLYCANYVNSLWNSDCIVAIDTDDDPANGCIVDCLIYSTRDGDPPSNLLPFMEKAVSAGAWICRGTDIQQSAFDIGKDGLATYMSIVRIGPGDSNGAADFALTRLPTPGRENVILSGNVRGGISRPEKKTVIRSVRDIADCDMEFGVYVLGVCDIDYEIFAPNGREIYSSTVFRGVVPGAARFRWKPVRCGKLLPTGLYLCRVRVRDTETGRREEHIVRLVLHNRRG